MKRLLFLAVLIWAGSASAQQYALYNTRTLFDAFENPERKIYTQDTSRKFSFNFFLPNMGTNIAATGDAQVTLRKLVANGVFSGRGMIVGQGRFNKIFVSNNTYIAMLRMYHNLFRSSEIGLSWQIRSDTYARITNETIAVFDNINLFDGGDFKNLFNNDAFSQNYHQFSITYRENHDKRLGWGVKASYLSGIAYQDIHINSSSITVNPELDNYTLRLDGKYRSSFAYSDENKKQMFIPNIKNPGLAMTAGATYKLRYGWTVSGHLKDIGAIRWSKSSPEFSLKQAITIEEASSRNASNRLGDKLDSAILQRYVTKPFIAVLNGKAEILLTKDYEHYSPSLLLSKNTFYRGADIGLIHQLRFGKINLGASTVYNTARAFQVGGMGMYKTPRFEVYMGSDQVFKTFSVIKGAIDADNEFGSGYTGSSLYFGIAFNFGPVVEHPLNTNKIPGISR